MSALAGDMADGESLIFIEMVEGIDGESKLVILREIYFLFFLYYKVYTFICLWLKLISMMNVPNLQSYSLISDPKHTLIFRLSSIGCSFSWNNTLIFSILEHPSKGKTKWKLSSTLSSFTELIIYSSSK